MRPVIASVVDRVRGVKRRVDMEAFPDLEDLTECPDRPSLCATISCDIV